MYLNKAIVYGNLTRDPELKSLPSGIQVVSFSLATNRVWKDQNGAKQEAVDYHNIVIFGKQAETAAQYLKKGSSVMIEGRMQTRSWDDKEGKKQYRTEIISEKMQFGPRAGGVSPGGTGSSYSAPKPATSAATSKDKKSDTEGLDSMDTVEYPLEDINPEEIPF